MNRPHLFLLDDEVSILLALSHLAQDAGWRVSIAKHPEDALALLSKNGADVFLTDYRMPKCDGLEVIETLRKSHPTLPVILMSGFSWEIDRDHAQRLGVLAILEKPFDSVLLIHMLNQAVSLKNFASIK